MLLGNTGISFKPYFWAEFANGEVLQVIWNTMGWFELWAGGIWKLQRLAQISGYHWEHSICKLKENLGISHPSELFSHMREMVIWTLFPIALKKYTPAPTIHCECKKGNHSVYRMSVLTLPASSRWPFHRLQVRYGGGFLCSVGMWAEIGSCQLIVSSCIISFQFVCPPRERIVGESNTSEGKTMAVGTYRTYSPLPYL